MLSNWTKATTTTTGTGTLTLAAVTGRPLPSKSKTVGEYVQYSIVTSDSKYESGIGKIAASDTLERSKVFSTYDGTTYNATSATALTLASGTHTVYLTDIAEAGFEPLHTQFIGPTDACVCGTNVGNTAGNFTPTVNHTHAFPIRIETAIVVSSMGLWVNTAGATSTFLLGLYEAGANGRPERLLCKTSATLSSATTGYKTQAVVTPVRINPGWYWAAVVVTAGTAPVFYGRVQTAGATGSANGYSYATGMKSSAAPGTDLVDPFPTTGLSYSASDSSTSLPHFGLIS